MAANLNLTLGAAAPMPRWALVALLVVAAWFLTTHFIHAFTEAINWDEFALLERADRTLRFGNVAGGGRPGLVPISLMWFVNDCIDSVRSVVHARLLWQVITLVYLAGVYSLVRRWFIHAGRTDQGHIPGVLAVALLAFLPAFITWSVQVRTDQAALASAVWGGVLLLSTSYRKAAVAGALFAIALLCTQKGAYTIALCGVLFATASAARIRTAPSSARTELLLVIGRSITTGIALILVLGGYALLVPEAAQLASGRAVASGLDVMNWTRASQGYRIYTVHAHRLVVHWVLLLVLIVWTTRVAIRRDASEYALLGCCWLVLLLGLIVVRFHGSSFPYFLMTAGLFPAVALSMASQRPLTMAGRMTWPITVSLVALVALQSLTESVEMLYDTQWEQRETMRLVYDSGLRNRRGYHVEGATFCARDPDPMPVMFSQDIARKFWKSPQAAQTAASFTAEFRTRPIAYIVESYRLNQLPDSVRQFLSEHYVWYARSLFVAGFFIDMAGTSREIDVIVPGMYRWQPEQSHQGTSVLVGGRELAAQDTIHLDAGPYVLATHEGQAARGSLMLADLPARERDAYPAFYHQRQIMQLGGYR